jgi:hypothetical protein
MSATAADRLVTSTFPGAPELGTSEGGRPPVQRTSRFAFELAADAGEADIRRILRTRALPGAVAMTFEREPHTALAASIEGDSHQAVIARDCVTGTIAGLAARSTRTLFVNGEPTRVGYLGQLRITNRRHGLRTLIDEGFAFLKTLHQDAATPAYLLSLIAENGAARRLLIDRHSATAPRFVVVGDLHTFVIPTRHGQRRRTGTLIQIERGSPDRLAEIAACLQRNLRRYQFAPRWTAADLESGERTRGLTAEDFAIAVAGGRIVGCLALWDQRAFKQVVVRGYSPAVRRTRLLINAASPLLGLPRLPAIGSRLEFAYLSHAAIDDDRAEILYALIAEQIRRAHQRGLDYVIAGFPKDHAFHPVIQRQFARRTYSSTLYIAHWDDGAGFAESLDGRIPQPEVAVL